MDEHLPLGIGGISALVESQGQEGPQLEFKRGKAFDETNAEQELVKDLSAFANAGGGRVIYGVAEAKNRSGIAVASAWDPVTHPKKGAEWISQIVRSNTSPPMNRFAVYEYPAPDGRSGRIVEVVVQQGDTAHQSVFQHKYFLRTARSAEPMLDSQIRDTMNRRKVPIITVTLSPYVADVSARRTGIVPVLKNEGLVSLDHWVLSIDVPAACLGPLSVAGINVRQEPGDTLNEVAITRITYTEQLRDGRYLHLHPGQSLKLNSNLGLPMIELQQPHSSIKFAIPIRWTLFTRDSKPQMGELSFDDWFGFR